MALEESNIERLIESPTKSAILYPLIKMSFDKFIQKNNDQPLSYDVMPQIWLLSKSDLKFYALQYIL